MTMNRTFAKTRSVQYLGAALWRFLCLVQYEYI